MRSIGERATEDLGGTRESRKAGSRARRQTAVTYHYLVCDPNDRVLRFETVECANDDAARALASKMLLRERAHTIEVWTGGRLVHRVSEGFDAR
jgi:hypothetical protein